VTPLWDTYLRPKTLAEALQAMLTAPKPLAPLAGGTDLLLDLQQGRHPPVRTLLDVTSVAEMTRLERRGDQLYIGAAVPVARLTRDPLVVAHARALTEACALIAGPQVRNVATLGGNVAHALPAADGTIALLALGAEAEVASLEGSRWVPLRELFLGPGRSALHPERELLVGFSLPLLEGNDASCFRRVMRPQGVALPILNCAVWLVRRGDEVDDIRIAIGPADAVPFRATQAEECLRGQPLTDTTVQQATQALLEQARFRTSPRRASADYRRHLVIFLFHDTLRIAWERATSPPS